MKIKQWIVSVMFFIIPTLGLADITVENHTNIYATGYAKRTCSSTAGARGVLQPYQTDYSIPQAALDSFCLLSNCIVHVYSSQDCSGTKIAIAEVDRRKGIINLTNLDTDHYEMIWSARHV